MVMMKILSWNINGIRSNVICAGKLKGKWEKELDKTSNLGQLIFTYDPDILCFQETKCDHTVSNGINIPNYYQYWNSSKGQNARTGNRYSGVSIWTKIKPKSVSYELPTLEEPDMEGRVIIAEFKDFVLMNTYCPNAGTNFTYRTTVWDKAVKKYLENMKKKGKTMIWCGDLNISPEPIDVFFSDPGSTRYSKAKLIGVGETAIAGFTAEEKENFKEIIEVGYVDTFRELNPDKKGQYSWWNTRIPTDRSNNLGMRLDYFIVNSEAMRMVKSSEILSDAGLLTKPAGSDHAPVLLTIDVDNMDDINVIEFTDKSIFSSKYVAPFTINDTTWNTVQHYYEESKGKDIQTVIDATYQKFKEHPLYKESLLNLPDNTYLIYTSDDARWGSGGIDKKGKNYLGKILTLLSLWLKYGKNTKIPKILKKKLKK